MNIYFKFDGRNYEVGQEAYDHPYIVLPDRRALQVNAWGETMPPQPWGLHEVLHIFQGSSPSEIAKNLNGILAIEVTK